MTSTLAPPPPPTFVTPDTKANAQLQHWSYKNAQLYYFFNVWHHHFLDGIMQMLWVKTQSSPLEGAYFSCVPYLLGEGQALAAQDLGQRILVQPVGQRCGLSEGLGP